MNPEEKRDILVQLEGVEYAIIEAVNGLRDATERVDALKDFLSNPIDEFENEENN